jgi:oxygen-independent coproporphyrinogen-3 oxidase
VTVRLTTPLTAFYNDLCDVIRVFWGDVRISPDEGETVIAQETAEGGGEYFDLWSCGNETAVWHARIDAADPIELKRLRKRAAKTGLYILMKQMTGVRPPWGSLTGIRPTRLLYEAMEKGASGSEAVRAVMGEYDVSADRASLLGEIAHAQDGLRDMPEGMFDLYIGIPFCTTRCAYCSFSSGEIGDGRLVSPYVEALLREIDGCGEMMREKGMRVRAAYVGGGTPTAIPCGDLERILKSAMAAFPGAAEWTVEAGRPDTIDREKLEMMKALCVGRVSVNPQSFSDETLQRIGRAHTGADTEAAFRLAREAGFDDINMDVIAGLPGENMDDFEKTLARVISLGPDSVTVHALAIKRSSRLHEELHLSEGGHARADEREAGGMIDRARALLTAQGYLPYYLYRQKYMAGNLENVGYAKPGKACLYNIGNMEETASVLALGAGGISKWIFDRQLRIERAPNVKNIEAYIARVDEMVSRKRALIMEGKGE